MGESCNICAQTYNPQGKVVDSKLFKDLLHYTSNDRVVAKRLYRIAMNSTFIDSVKDRARFDDNGEIVLQDLLKFSKSTLNSEKVLSVLNKDIEAGNYSYQEAMRKLQDFNRNSAWKDKYMATITPVEGDKYALSIVKRDASRRQSLVQTIGNNIVQSKIISLLKANGVAVDFLEDAPFRGRYSTADAYNTADGLYHFIQIRDGENIDETLAEEAGHFIVGALGNSPLVNRLINALTPDVQREVLGEEDYRNKYLGKNARREVAGDVVGKALLNKLNGNSIVSRLAQRIVNLAKRMFYNIKRDQVAIDRLKVERLAEQIADGFMSPNFDGNIENALQSDRESLYSVDYSTNAKVYKQVASILNVASEELKGMNSSLSKVFQALVMQMQSNGREHFISTSMGEFSDAAALAGLVDAVEQSIIMLQENVGPTLQSVDFDNNQDFITNFQRNGHSLRESRIALTRVFQVLDVVSSSLSSAPGTSSALKGDLTNIRTIDEATGKQTFKDLIQLTNKLDSFRDRVVGNTRDAAGSLFTQLMHKEFQFFLKFVTDRYGSEYVDRGAKVMFIKENLKGKGFIRGLKESIVFAKAIHRNSEDFFKEALEYLETDISYFDRFLGSMANSGDIIGQIIDKVTKQANKNADDMTNRVWDDLKALKVRMKSLGISDPTVFYERDRQGNLTGNVISSVLWGEWEKDHENFKNEERQKFLDTHKREDGSYDFEGKTEFEKALMWQKHFSTANKNWHKKYSTYNSEEGRYVPRDDVYHNSTYDSFTLEEKQWLAEFMSLKASIDNLVGGAMPPMRLPQFKGTFMNRVRNRGSRLNPALYAQGMWDIVKETFCKDSEDRDYGGYMTFNEVGEDLFDNQVAFEKEKMNRLTLFGINKLDDVSQLSTDIFSSMLAFTGMATHYAAMGAVIDTFEVGKTVLLRRRVGGLVTEEKSATNKSRAFNRYIKYLEKQVYGVSIKNPMEISGGVVLGKIASFLTNLGSTVYLGGNVMGGMVNFGTGFTEIFKEAAAGEFYTLKDWASANATYWKSLPNLLWDTGKLDKSNKLGLFIRHFNVKSENQGSYRRWSTYQSRVASFIFGESLMLPYSAGDHYMQTMSYLALAKGTKLIDINGNQTSLWDAYKVVDIEHMTTSGNVTTMVGRKKYGKTLSMDKQYFKSEEDRQEYLMLQSIINIIESRQQSNPLQTVFTDAQIEYLRGHGYNWSDPFSLSANLAKLKDVADHKVWNDEDESAFMDKSREINDRLHGIYNEQDKTAMHQNIFGRALLSMRGYALGMFERRLGTQKYSVALGTDTEGTLRTAAKVILSCATDSWGFGKTLRAFLLPFSKQTENTMLEAGFSASQYRNMRRNFMDYSIITVLIILKMLTANPEDDDEKEKELYYEELRAQGVNEAAIKAQKEQDRLERESAGESINLVGLANYFATRLLREQMAYNTTMGFEDEWSNVTSLMPTGVSVVRDLWNLCYYVYGDMVYDYVLDDPEYYEELKSQGVSQKEINQIRRQRTAEIKEMNEPGKEFFYQKSSGLYEKGDPKWKRKFYNMIPYYRSISALYHPYEAVKNFMFGRKVKK